MAFVHPSHLILSADVCAYFLEMCFHFVCFLVWKPFTLCMFLFTHLRICIFNYLLAQFWCVHVSWLLHYAPSSFCLFHVKRRWWFASFTWLYFSFFRPHSIQTRWQIQSFLQSRVLTCLVQAKIAFLFCRSEGFCCDKSDSLTEQLRGLLAICLSFDWLTCGWLNDWLVFSHGDMLTR